MNLHEHDSKQRFAEFGIPVLPGRIATTAVEAYQIARQLGGPVMIKAQVLVGNRIKRGGVRRADTPGEAGQHAEQILGTNIAGWTVRSVLIEPAVDIVSEIYLGVTNDRAARKPVLVTSAEGGIDLEDMARADPSAILREHIDPFFGLCHHQAMDAANYINLPRAYWQHFSQIAQALYRCYTESDATLAEINPLVITTEGHLLAVDGKMSIDDNALYRQVALAEKRDADSETPAARLAREIGIAYVKLDGQIGCVVNGAGLAMTVMDLIQHYSSGKMRAANFLDIGGGAKSDKVASALKILLTDTKVRSILVNIFGGITRCDDVVNGIIAAHREMNPEIPFVVRLKGTNASEGIVALQDANLPYLITATTLTDAVQRAIWAAER